MSDLVLYSMPSSGNSYKVRLLLALLGRDYTHVPVETQSAEIAAAKAKGQLPQGKAPALHLGDGEILTESNAILWYLAQGSGWIPQDPLAQARMLGWMFFEQNRHEPVVAVRASLRCYPHLAQEATEAHMAELLDAGHAILQIMEEGLGEAPYFGGARPDLADIALYAYTHTAGERGGFDMERYPGLRAWIERIAALPGYVELMPDG
ncbi:glutathione S-transferase family protein [Marimonas lutisalis]|uniref:glutathione S-transferase family protein n=1 Tax=Marimonas lutisalis TaxID=2545756 RepID=UPI0010FA2BD1|nr:glutathione S-transferase family protein [Marimonas lutisalis]